MFDASVIACCPHGMQKPEIGDIVRYIDSQDAKVEHPAIIEKVFSDEGVALCVFNGGPNAMAYVKRGRDLGHWHYLSDG